MSRLDPRLLELIHAELDGELDGAGLAELDARCAADPAAREHREQLRRIAGALARMPEIEPPAGLGRRWQGGSPATPVRFGPRRRRWVAPAIGLAAAALAVAIALGIAGPGRQLLDTRDLVGTLGGASSGPARQQVAIRSDDVTGQLRLVPATQGWTLEMDLRSAADTDVSASWDPQDLRLLDYRGGQDGARVEPGRFAIVTRGEQHLNLDLQPTEGGPVRIRIRGAGGATQEISVTVPGASPP